MSQTKFKILILADKPGWVVDRNIDNIIEGIPADFTKEYYALIDSEKLLRMTEDFDLVHYGNSDLSFHLSVVDKIRKPFLISIRSHRYGNYVDNLQAIIARNKFNVHVINRELLAEFPGSTYIPNGISPQFLVQQKEFVVGFAGKPTEYKGFDLIQKACEELGVTFRPATGDIDHSDMREYYDSIDLLVSASINEGHCNPVFECMALNIPIITTDVGSSKDLNLVKIERSIESIKKGILKFYTYPQVKSFTWENANKQMFNLYNKILTNNYERIL